MPDLAMLDYFYGDEAEQFTFYRIPKVLFTDPSYRRISSDAKILYGLMLDRMGLSVRNGWLDEYNRVFIFFTLEDALEYLCCGHTKAVSLFGELDKEGLIERKKQGQGKPTKIYVKNFVRNAEVLTSEKRKSKVPQSGSQDFQKTASNNTEIKDTELSDTEPSIHPARGLPEDKSPAADAMDTMRVYRQIIMENIEYDITRRQRRRRIFLVADFGGHSAGEILFESESVWRHYQESREQREKAAADLGGGTFDAGTGADIVCLMDQGGQRMDVYRNLIGTLLAHSSSTPPIIMASSQANAEIGIGYCPTITAAAGMAGNNQPILFDNHGPDTRYSGPVKVAQTITSALGTGGNNTPLAVHGEPYCIAGNVINRQDKNGGNGCGYQQGVSYTLTTEDRHCVAYTDDLQRKKRVRKLIPLECERLMGFPDHWTDIPGASDSVRYRALGNSVAVPCVEYILCGIAYFLERQEGERDVHIPG